MAIKITENSVVNYENEPNVDRELFPNLNETGYLPEDYQQLIRDVDTLKSDVTSINGEITDMQGDITTAENNIEDLDDSVTELKNDLSELERTYSAFVVETETGAIASFSDGADDVPVKDLTVAIEPVQSGSGDPSPENIRPISGWTGANVTRTGKNLFGGIALRDGVLNSISSATTDAENKTVTFTNTASTSQPISKGIPFKDNTPYTLILTASKNSTPSVLNMRIIYTDDTSTNVNGVTDVNKKRVSVTVSNPNKTIKAIVKFNGGGTTTLYYDECGVFEGELTASNFEPYQGETVSVDWTTEAGTVYGGTLDVTTGVLTADRAGVNMGELDWKASSTAGKYYASIQMYPMVSNLTMISSCYAFDGIGNSGNGYYGGDGTFRYWYTVGTTSYEIYAHDDRYSDVASLKAGINGQTLVSPLATPVTYQLTPQEVSTILGQNNIFADTGDATVQYRADTKLYIDKVLSA